MTTSRAALRQIEFSGLADRQKAAIYDVLRRGKPMTGGEIDKACLWYPRHVSRKRLSEMERAGLVERTGKRACLVTGMTCWTWAAQEATTCQ